MRFAVVLQQAGFFRFIEPVLRALAPGDEVDLVLPDPESLPVSARREALRVHRTVARVETRTQRLRDLRDCSIPYRWIALANRKPEFVEHLLGHLPRRYARWVRWLHRARLSPGLAPRYLDWLAREERRQAPDEHVLSHLAALAPDVLIATPVVYPIRGRAFEIDYLKAAQALGIRSAVLVASWDNLSTKGSFHVAPDRVLVWNEIQIRELEQYHAIPAERAVAVGAPVFDQMFDPRLLDDRARFCARAGLDPARPFALWVATSRASRADELDVVAELLTAMQAHPELRAHQLLVRPHPKHRAAFERLRRSDAVVWQSPGFPETEPAARDLYNSIVHAEAVAGLSTSAFIETAILDRPCALISNARSAPNSLYAAFAHFEILLGLGYPEVARDEFECARWLAQVARGADAGAARRRDFVRRFVRPRGLDAPASVFAARALRELGESRAAPRGAHQDRHTSADAAVALREPAAPREPAPLASSGP
jgi:hypothetical protein